jgi:hypothetical protein
MSKRAIHDAETNARLGQSGFPYIEILSAASSGRLEEVISRIQTAPPLKKPRRKMHHLLRTSIAPL